jgi:hypothetical protein
VELGRSGHGLLERGAARGIGRLPTRTSQERWADVDGRHSEVLPLDWPETAGATRERSLYVDCGDAGWTSPADTLAGEFDGLRPAVAQLLLYLAAAYEREIALRIPPVTA